MKVLVACEFSGTVRDAFIRRGHDAVSCDLLPSRNGGPHHQGPVEDILCDGWDLMIAHPPCTYITVSAEWAYGDGPYHQEVKEGTLVGEKRRIARIEALNFVRLLMSAPIKRIAIENPIGAISSAIREPDQIIQPNKFGHDASKATCLWLKNLLPLQPTKHVAPRIVPAEGAEPDLLGHVAGLPRWGNQTDSGQNKLSPSSDRWALRSETYSGIAEAMANQWGTQ